LETAGGLLVADINADVCARCGLCLKVCPGTGIDTNRYSIQENGFFCGPILEAYSCQATDSDLLKESQSGGLVSALLIHLLNRGWIDAALLTKMPDNGSLRPEVFVAHTAKEILEARGSKYCPAALNAILTQLKDKKAVCVVGLGCHMHGLIKACDVLPWLRPIIKLKVGLFCNRTMSYRAIDYLVNKASMRMEEVKTITYKSKKFSGWPGDVVITAQNGEESVIERSVLGKIWTAFTPFRCLLCHEKWNTMSDIAVGDAWGLPYNKAGLSVALARTESGQSALLSAQKADVIHADSIPVGKVLRQPQFAGRIYEWKHFTAYAKINNQATPCFGSIIDGTLDPLSRVPWSLARRYKISIRLASDRSISRCLRRIRRYMIYTDLFNKLRHYRQLIKRRFFNNHD
jgi:coenzyme F420 hydrogenase subunit beta